MRIKQVIFPRLLLLLISFFPVIVVSSPNAPSTIASSAPATPVATQTGVCTVSPKPRDEALALVGTPYSTFPYDLDDLPLFPSQPNEPASPEILDAIRETARAFVECSNTGDSLQLLTFMTDRLISRSMNRDTLTEESGPVSPAQYYSLVDVVYGRQFPDGRVGAIIILEQAGSPGLFGSVFFMFANSGERWLVDGFPLYFPESEPLPPDDVPDVPIVNGEVPDPADCTVEPRSIEEYNLVVATPAARPEPGDERTPISEVAGPAESAVIDAITKTTKQWIACMNAGDRFRTSMLFSDAFFDSPYFSLNLDDLQGPLAPSEWTGYLGIFNPVMYENGDVGAIVALDSTYWPPVEPLFLLFTKVGDSWLIDSVGGELGQEVEVISE